MFLPPLPPLRTAARLPCAHLVEFQRGRGESVGQRVAWWAEEAGGRQPRRSRFLSELEPAVRAKRALAVQDAGTARGTCLPLTFCC